MSYLDNLPAAARGYKVPGRKLLPRDWEFGARMRMGGIRSVKALKKEEAIEAAAMGYKEVPYKKKHLKAAQDFYCSDFAGVEKFRNLPKPVREILNKQYAEEARYAEDEAYGSY